MTTNKPTPEQEYEYYSQPDNQQPQGPPQRRQPRLSAIVPVRFHQNCSMRSVDAPRRTTGPCPPGSAAQSNTNFAVRAD